MSTETQKARTPSEWLSRWHIDLPLLIGVASCTILGLFVLYSASGRSPQIVTHQAIRIVIGVALMFAIAQVPPHWYRTAAPWAFGLGLVLLVLVLLAGDSAMGAQRWLDLGLIRFQPSVIMKLTVPLMVAAFLHERRLPPGLSALTVVAAMIAVPTALVALQPDLGTALLIVCAGVFAVYLAGLRWRAILLLCLLAAAAAPLLWFFMHDYQQQRVLTFFNPARDPLGAGYHIIQSKIAVGSGGLFGKGWLNGTQAHLNFLPDSDTDFIFAVFAEEWGLLGVLALLVLYSFIVLRGLLIAARSQNTFQRLTAGSISLTFFIYVFVNIGMVIGILPVVGVPLPLISYGGTSMIVLMVAFGILMSISTHRNLMTK